jgi:subtilase family serine protease
MCAPPLSFREPESGFKGFAATLAAQLPKVKRGLLGVSGTIFFEAVERLVSAMIVSEAPPDAAQPRFRTADIQEGFVRRSFTNGSRLGQAVKLGTILRSIIVGYLFFVTLPGYSQPPRQTLSGHVRPAIAAGRAVPAGLLPASGRLNLSIVLPVRNKTALASLLGRLYDPSSSDYHQFLSPAQFAQQFAPSEEDYQAVVAYAQANGFTVTDAPANRLVVPITGTVAQVEKAFNVKMGLYRHPTENRLFFSPDREPSLSLAVPVAHIAGLNNFAKPQPMVRHASAQAVTSMATAGSGPGGSFLASDMRAAYYGGSALTGTGQTVGLFEFDGYNASDVDLTFTSAGQSNSVPIQNVLLDGATGAPVSNDDSEEVIDIVQAIGMAPGLSQVRVYIGSNDVDILNSMAAEDLARQISIAWSWSPDDPAVDDIFFEEFAAQGQSVFVSSGDWGEFDPYFDDFYPAEDAFVTAVGGTDLTTTGADGAWVSETAWDRSGGGISPDGIPIPAWQASVATSSNGGSSTLRNVPDVAAEADADNYICNMGVCDGNYGGTSFSAPRWAGFMALVNQQAASSGDPSVGFLNPSLYALGESSAYSLDFHDITVGNNDARSSCCGWPYYSAVPGYDLVTGWGSPAGQSLIDALAPATPASFELSSSATTVTLSPGASGTTTITVTGTAGFSGSVNLVVSGLPAGVTATWGVNPATTSSVLTLTASRTAARGSYLLTVSGVSGSTTEATSFVLDVNAPGFSLMPSPSNLKIYPGTSSSTAISITGFAGFSGSVSLAVTSALPTGVTASWVSNPTTSSSTLTLTASDSAPANSDAVVTITGTSGSQTATTTLALVVSPPLFYLNLSPYPSTIAQGTSITTIVSAVPVNNFTDTIRLSAPQLPPGVTASFSPASITFSQTSVLTLTASSSAPLGTSVAGIEGDGSLSGTLNQFNLTVTAAAAPSFALNAAQSSLTLVQGSTVSDTFTVAPQHGFTGNVSLALTSPLPGGVTASFSPNPATGTSQLTLTAGSSATAGYYVLWIKGTSGTQSAVASVFLTVNPPPSFTLETSPSTLTVTQGATNTATETVVPQAGFTGSVNLTIQSMLPDNVSMSFAPNPTTGSSLLTVTASYSVPVGTYPVILAGTSGGITVTETISLVIGPAAVMPTHTSLSIMPSGGYLAAGSTYMLSAAVSPAGGSARPTGSVVFTIGSATQTVAVNSAGTATLATTAPTTPGTFTISAAYQGANGFSASTSNLLTETVTAVTPAAFSLDTTAVSIAPGATTGNTSTVTVTPSGGFTGAVTLTASIASAPSGATHLPSLTFGSTTPVNVNGSSSATAVLTISTTAGTVAMASPTQRGLPWYTSGGAALACLLFFGFVPRRRAWQAFLGVIVLFLILAGGVVGCGGAIIAPGSQSGSGTTPGLYVIAVTGESGSTTASAHVALTVQ